MRITYLFLILLLASSSNAERTPIETAIIEGKEEGFFELLMRFKDAPVDRSQHTVLSSLAHLAVAFNRAAMILMLDRAGYPLNTLNEAGMTPLDVADVMGRWEIARTLRHLRATFGRQRVERALLPPNADIPAQERPAPPPAIVIRPDQIRQPIDRSYPTRPQANRYQFGFYRSPGW